MEKYPRADERSAMVEHQIRARGISNARILDAMRADSTAYFYSPPL